MSTTKHTPTPWRIHEEFPDTIIGLDGVEIACCDNYSSVAATENEKTDAANAAFIVQCVNEREELLAALKALAELVGKNPPPTGGISTLAQWSDGHAAALAAIAKAVAK